MVFCDLKLSTTVVGFNSNYSIFSDNSVCSNAMGEKLDFAKGIDECILKEPFS